MLHGLLVPAPSRTLLLSQELPSQKRLEFSCGAPAFWRPAPVVPRMGAACTGDAMTIAVSARLAAAAVGVNLIMWSFSGSESVFVECRRSLRERGVRGHRQCMARAET